MMQQQRRAQANERNQQLILQALSIFTPITTGLLGLEHQLYSLAEMLPRPLFKLFRTLRDDVETLFSLISAYSSAEEDFNQQKDSYLQQQIQAIEAEVNRKPTPKERPVESRTRNHNEPRKGGIMQLSQSERQIELLVKEVESLKNQLRRNDSEYEIEIKKYNYKYQEMQEEIEYYRRECLRSQEYLQTIEQLEVELRAMQEAKERDEQLIQNMAWKLRNLERQRYGRTAFLSPKASQPALNGSYSRIHTQYSPKRHLHSRDE